MLLSELPDGHVVAVDTESSHIHPDDGGRLSVVSYAYRDPDTGDIVARSLPFDQGVMWLPLGDKDLPPRHTKRLAKWPTEDREENAGNLCPEQFLRLVDTLNRMSLVYHHAKHDMHIFNAGLRNLRSETGNKLTPQFLHDTYLGQKVWEPQLPAALKASAVRHMITEDTSEQDALAPYLGPKSGKAADPRYDLVPWHVMKLYATADARYTLELYEIQRSYFARYADKLHFLERDMELCLALYYMESEGVLFDTPRANESATHLQEEIKRVEERLPFRATQPGAKKFFFTDAGRPPYPDKLTATGQPQTDEEVISRLVADGVKWAAEFQHHQDCKSALSKWYLPWPAAVGEDGRIRPTYRQSHTVSYRLSAKRVQLHAMPHDHIIPDVPGVTKVRRLLIPDPGTELWEFDVSQAEVRIATALTHCNAMLASFESGIDSHSAACMQMFGLTPDDKEWEYYRHIAKQCNLGILYGASQRELRRLIQQRTRKPYSLAKCKDAVAKWRKAFPELAYGIKAAEQQAVNLGYVPLVDGRPAYMSRWVWAIDGLLQEPPHKAFNRRVQGSLAVVMNLFLARTVETEVLDQEPQATTLLQVHDSLVQKVHAPDREDYAAKFTAEMKAFFEDWFQPVPFECDAKRFGGSS